MHSLNDLVLSGQECYLGVSDTHQHGSCRKPISTYGRDHGLRQFVIYPGTWNAAMRDCERDIIPTCRDEGMDLIMVLGHGDFQTNKATSRLKKAASSGRKTTRGGRLVPKLCLMSRSPKYLEKLARAVGRAITDLALAYVLHKTPDVFPIVHGRKLEHIRGNVAALKAALSDAEIEEIEAAHPFDAGVPSHIPQWHSLRRRYC